MGFKKELYVCLISVVFIAACGKRYANVDTVAASLQVSSLEDGQSLGDPQTEDTQHIENEIAERLVLKEDTFSNTEDFSHLNDQELEEAYGDEWNSLNDAIDSFATTGVFAPQETSIMGAAKRGGGMSGMSCLGLGIQGEAGGESMEGMIAVGRTLLRRAGGNMGKVCSALFARGQFESMMKRPRKVSAASLRAAQQSAKLGSWPYDHFINKVLQRKLGRKIPAWVIKFEKRGCLVKNVGLHTFYASQNCKRK